MNNVGQPTKEVHMNNNSILLKIKLLDQAILKEMLNDENRPEKKPTPTQMRIMKYIVCHKKEEILQKDLEKALGITRATVSDVLSTMEKRGIIKREISNNDTRVKRIIIQEKAIRIMQEGELRLRELEKRITNDIKEEELAIFEKVIDNMIKNIENKEEEPC